MMILKIILSKNFPNICEEFILTLGRLPLKDASFVLG